ncbi:MAG: hypothetical protein CEE42_15710 [Promethearchaeota archaeon Loki_b31]|nr:MAG: hypothetical protein CEE42_15710 [Candidatus Lokiarchaeota archaeon Loki_b31]
MYYNGGIKLEKKNSKKLGLPISSKTGEPLKPFIKPGDTLLLGITFIALGLWWWYLISRRTLPVSANFLLFICFLVEGCLLISRAKLGNKHVLAHQIIVLIIDLFIFFMGFVFSIILGSILGLLGMVGGIIIIIICTLVSTIHCIYWLVKLEKYKVKN